MYDTCDMWLNSHDHTTHNDTEELEKNLQQAEKEWKEYKKVAMPPPKPMATWDNATSKAPAKLTAEQKEEAAVFNQDSNWAKCNGLVVIAAALPGNRELGRGIRMYNISKLTD
ncbi:hypothetical protein LPJ76_006386 [Coemansia sp. RSA 638]|nr:hypothetical protein LPJ76_006386 [Coemansia sp. RSA 638]